MVDRCRTRRSNWLWASDLLSLPTPRWHSSSGHPIPASDRGIASPTRFARTDAEAAERYKRYRTNDPFPDILPALLNSADIEDYVAATGMIHPFRRDKDWLKPASYEVAVGGPYQFWKRGSESEKDVPVEANIKAGEPFELSPNSIAFVTLEPMFRLPEYIAVRFNLKIKNIYRGLLLGTGPLVDPGFCGPLHVPLHNLTTNTYTIVGGEGLIWMEFTKLSPRRDVAAGKDNPERVGRFYSLPSRKLNLTLGQYLRQAAPDRPIVSSVAAVVEGSRADARRAADSALTASRSVERTRNLLLGFGGVASVVAVATLLGLYFSAFSLVNDTNKRVNDLNARIGTLSQSPTPVPSDAVNARLCVLERRLNPTPSSTCP